MGFDESFQIWFLVLIGIGVIISSIGFVKFIWFIFIGYGFSVAGMGAGMLIIFRNSLTIGTTLACILFIVYGCRLGGYLAIREIKSTSYKNLMKSEIKDKNSIKVGSMIATWLGCALLYALQVSAVYFRLSRGMGTDVTCIVGVAIMALGIFTESLADFQKSSAKKKNPTRFCDKGLYRIVRCPNYLGEILFWTGAFVSGTTAMSGAWQWISALIGYLCIVYIMFGGARRLEIRQNKNYGADEEYQKYVKKTPIIIPLIPLYSVEKHKWLVG